ncbi:hypothetical protein D3877_12035 [Azospirillum cavernae]|uniref:N-acetyltransferase domain-containing protein n=1 Tax=Azospirillum cavernae TaxID=2320860 RepID=A0A418VUX0_9PROT|nr:hypothetical protein [Azospirillum cavernae]RJF80956.1 hypothetical protein D3877_12035 [Azospirillum cavernae]
MIRPAKFSDILGLADLIAATHQRSVYADRATLDVARFKTLCVSAIQSHGKGSCLFVAVSDDGTIGGFILGVVDRLYGIAKELYATDLFFCVAPGTDARAASGLADAFLSWAERAPGVIEVRPGVSGAVEGWRRAGTLWERKGLRLDGAMYVRRVR